MTCADCREPITERERPTSPRCEGCFEYLHPECPYLYCPADEEFRLDGIYCEACFLKERANYYRFMEEAASPKLKVGSIDGDDLSDSQQIVFNAVQKARGKA